MLALNEYLKNQRGILIHVRQTTAHPVDPNDMIKVPVATIFINKLDRTIGVAVRNMKDHFHKKIGRDIAFGKSVAIGKESKYIIIFENNEYGVRGNFGSSFTKKDFEAYLLSFERKARLKDITEGSY